MVRYAYVKLKGVSGLELYIQQRVFSLGDKYDVYNEQQEPVYHVQGEFFSWGAKIHLYDLDGNELYYIRQKLLAFLPEYAVYQGDAFCARIKKEFSFLHPRLTVESGFGNFEITGNILDMDYEILRDGETMGEIHKKWLSWGDAYLLSIRDYKDAAFLTALAIAVDNCLHNDSKKH
jgi:uncharacterized protein YxjI